MDMEALFAEMRKAQTGGVDFAAEAAEKREREEKAERDARRAAAGDPDDGSDDSDGSDSDVDESRGECPRGLTSAEERRLWSLSHAGRASAERERRSGGGGGGWASKDASIGADPATEAARHRAVAALAAKFESTCGHALGGRWWSHFESWLYARRAAATRKGKKSSSIANADADPVTPDPELARHDPDLHRKLTASGMSEYDAKGVGMALQRATAAALAQVRRESAGAASLDKKKVKLAEFAVGGGGGGADVEDDTAPQHKKVKLTCGKVSVEVNSAHLQRLRVAFERFAPVVHRHRDDAFRRAAFACLARYSSQQGAHYKAGGMQASLPAPMFDALREHFGVAMELCASPLNARYRRFCSGHVDVDECFGSFGDCLKFEPDAGSFEVNPPFDPTFMAAVCGHMERLLANASGAMSFAVIVPRRPEDASWSKLTNSRYAVKRIDFEAGAHAYVPGGQHVRSARATPSAAATTLVLLQNEAGRGRWPATREAVDALRAGFASGLKKSNGDDEEDEEDVDVDGSGESDVTDDDGFGGANGRGDGGGRVNGGAVVGSRWDFEDVRRLFWGAGSAGRWGKKGPAGWVVDAVGECIEDHWVGDDPETDGEDDEDEGEEDGEFGEVGDGSESESDDDDDDGDDDDEDDEDDDSDLDLEEGDEYGSEDEDGEDPGSSDEEFESDDDEAPLPRKKVRR